MSLSRWCPFPEGAIRAIAGVKTLAVWSPRKPWLNHGESPGVVPGLSVVLLVVRRQGFEPRTQ